MFTCIEKLNKTLLSNKVSTIPIAVLVLRIYSNKSELRTKSNAIFNVFSMVSSGKLWGNLKLIFVPLGSSVSIASVLQSISSCDIGRFSLENTNLYKLLYVLEDFLPLWILSIFKYSLWKAIKEKP